MDDTSATDVEVIDAEELERFAMSADPDAPVPEDAIPFVADHAAGVELLPDWYMPAPQSAKRTPARMLGAAAFVGALLIVNGAGLCVTYGLPEIAW